MATTYIKTPDGRVLEATYTGKVKPTANQVLNAYAKGGKDIRISGIKVAYDPTEEIGWGKGLINNAVRGLSLGSSRYLENKADPGGSRALDSWNKKHPVASTVADIAGSIPLFVVPGGAAKVVSKIPTLMKVLKAVPGASGAAKAAGFFGKHPIIKNAVQGAAYSGGRANIESRDIEPDRVLKNTGGSALVGGLLGAMFSAGGNTVSKLVNRNKTLAQSFIDKVGGAENFKKLVSENGRLIDSADPLVADLLRSSKLKPVEKVAVIDKLNKNSDALKGKVSTTIEALSPKKSQESVNKLAKILVDKRYEKVDPTKVVDLNVSHTVGYGKPGKATITMKTEALPEARTFVEARKKAEGRRPATMGHEKGLSKENEISLEGLKGVRSELFDIMNQHKANARNQDAAEVARVLKSLGEKVKEVSPEMHKADRTFSRAQKMKENYAEGLNFKGFKAGEEPPMTTSFNRGIMDNVKSNRRNISPSAIPTKLEDVVSTPQQNALARTMSEKLGGLKEEWSRLGNERTNLQAAASNIPAYEKAVNLHGADAARFISMPMNAMARTSKKALGAIEGQYEYSPKQTMQAMYSPAKDVYSKVVKHAQKKHRTGKVLATVMSAMARTGGRPLWGGKY
jgi:hypothetical protein